MRTWEQRGWPYLAALALFPVTATIARVVLGDDPKGAWAVPTFLGAVAALTGLAITTTLSALVSAFRATRWSVHSARLAAAQLFAGAGLQWLFSVPMLSEFPHWLGLPWLAGAIIVLATMACLGIRRRHARSHVEEPAAR